MKTIKARQYDVHGAEMGTDGRPLVMTWEPCIFATSRKALDAYLAERVEAARKRGVHLQFTTIAEVRRSMDVEVGAVDARDVRKAKVGA
jgi:acyl-CoA hydrolase